MSKNTLEWTTQTTSLISRSEIYESSTPNISQAIHDLMGSLAQVTTSSFTAKAAPAAKTPAANTSSNTAPAPVDTGFSATKKEYQPALQNRTLATALAELQQMRQKNRANVAPRIVTSQFRAVQSELGRVHRPKK